MEQTALVFKHLRHDLDNGTLIAVAVACSRCDRPPRPGQSYCVQCHADYMREWRRARGGRSAESIEARWKDSARSYAGVYKRRGKLIPGTCVDCGSADVEMHHEDYAQPITVIWLCRRCHLVRHPTGRGLTPESLRE